MAFYGAVVKASGLTPYVPPPEDGWALHLSQAALSADVPLGARVSLLVKHGDDPATVVCTLCAGTLDSVALDLFFNSYAEFSVVAGSAGAFPIHISGYFSPDGADSSDGGGGQDMEDMEEDDEDEDEDDMGMMRPKGAELARLRKQLLAAGCNPEALEGMMNFGPGGGPEGDSDGDEDESEVEDEDSDDYEDEDEAPAQRGGRRSTPSVTIEEVTEEEALIITSAKAAKGGKKEAAPQPKVTPPAAAAPTSQAGAKRPAADAAPAAAAPSAKKHKEEKAAPAAATPVAKAQPAAAAKAPTPAPASVKASKPAEKAKPAAPVASTSTPAKSAAKSAPASPAPSKADAGKAGEVDTGRKNVRRWENGLEIEDVVMGQPAGKLAKAGKVVSVRYTGRLKSNGKVFDASKGAPFKFRLGVGEVISGWDKGVEGMRVGCKRKLTIPPQMAYGSSGMKGAIPPNATLEFDVELVDVR